MNRIHQTIIFILFLSLSFSARAQLSIEKCYDMARSNYPLLKQYDMINITEEYTMKNAYMMYLPQISITGKATYQTKALEFPFEIPGIDLPVFSKDQYQIALELSQVIWDGGSIYAQRKNIKAKSEITKEEYEVDMYQLRDRVNNLYFGILLLGEQINQTNLLLENLHTNNQKIVNCIELGVANQSDLDVIEVEEISTRQKKAQMETLRKAYLRMLTIMIGEEVNDSTEFIKPVPEAVKNPELISKLILSENKRPELRLFDARKKEIDTQWDYWTAGGLPSISLFIKGAYGRPGLNFMSNNFDLFAYGGVQLVWNISKLYSLNYGKKIISSSKQQVDMGKDAFLFNTNLQTEGQLAEIQKYFSIMADDDNVIRLREKIRKAAENEVVNGTMSASDLIMEINKEEIAKQAKIVHEIELIKSIYELKTIKNNYE